MDRQKYTMLCNLIPLCNNSKFIENEEHDADLSFSVSVSYEIIKVAKSPLSSTQNAVPFFSFELKASWKFSVR